MRVDYPFQYIRLTVFTLVSLVLVMGASRLKAQAMIGYDDILYYSPDVTEARLDVYLPAGIEAPYPTVVYVTPPAFNDENVMRYYAAHLIEQGYAAVSVKIRPQHISLDSFCGLAWVHANAGEYGFDTQRIVAFGISGSGVAVATFGTIDRDMDNPFMEDCPNPEPESAWVQGVVTYEAVLQTPVGLSQELIRSDSARFLGLSREEIDGLYDLLIQTPPAEWRDIEDTGYQPIIRRFPLYWVDGSEPPFLLIYGSETELSWMEDEQRTFAGYLEAVGVSVELVEKEGLGHSVDALVGHTEEMDTFLAEIFGGADTAQPPMPVPITPDNVDQIEELAAFEQNTVCTATFSPTEELLASGGGGTVALWNIADRTVINSMSVENRSVRSIAFSSDGTRIAATSMGNYGDTRVGVWDVATGDLLLEQLEDFEHMATGVALSPDGTMVAAGTGCVFDVPGSASVKVWDITSGMLRFDIPMPSFVTDVAFSPDGTLLVAAAGDGIVRLWDVESGALRTELRGHSGGISSVAFSPDGRTLASSSDNGTAYLWDVASGEPLYRLDGPVGEVVDVAFSADGRLVVIGGGSHTLAFWDAVTGDLLTIREVGVEGNFVYSVAFNAENTLLATCGHDQMLRLWGVQGQ